ncbi:hypothetical protein [Neobacillus sp.]|uniref:hypothetical protein n=1 Tax=Neobacillus sp. TaxID=2675273 RepID=UPI00289A9629|nr:hypothetical protein [Neobacillus sp.]
MKVVNLSNGTSKQLGNSKSLLAGHGLLIRPCQSIHSSFMYLHYPKLQSKE